MAQQTALQELLQWVRATLPMDLDTPRMIEEKIESLLPKEKEQTEAIREMLVQGASTNMSCASAIVEFDKLTKSK